MIPTYDIRLDPKATEPDEALYSVLAKVRPQWNRTDIHIKVAKYFAFVFISFYRTYTYQFKNHRVSSLHSI